MDVLAVGVLEDGHAVPLNKDRAKLLKMLCWPIMTLTTRGDMV